MKRDDKAFAYFEAAITLKPELAAAYYARAIARIEKGEKEKACADLIKAIEFGDPNAAAMKQKNCN